MMLRNVKESLLRLLPIAVGPEVDPAPSVRVYRNVDEPVTEQTYDTLGRLVRDLLREMAP